MSARKEHKHVPWYLWPFWAIWQLIAWVVLLTGRVVAVILGLVLMIILSALATILPATMGPRADPLTTPEIIKPEWFFYVSFRWLKLFSLTFAVLSSGFIVMAMIGWPWIDRLLRRITRVEEISVYIGIVATFVLIGLTVWEAAVAH